MRRIIAAVLLIALVIQRPANAKALTEQNGPEVRLSVASILEPLQSFVIGSVFFAALTGQYSRYAVEHAPPPQFKRLTHAEERPPDVRSSRLAHYHTRDGVTLKLPRLHQPGTPRTMRTDISFFGTHKHYQVTSTSFRARRPTRAQAAQGLGRVGMRSSNAILAGSGTLSAATTGVNRWWVYAEQGIPGVGKAYVNVNTGNLLVSVTDIDLPERGIDLALRRTYNSMSKHDASGTDGSSPSVFGNGWTSTFDAHLSSPGGTMISVWDTDGARYDFDCTTSPCLNLTAGDHTKLYLDPLNKNCTWAWEKKSGTIYDFYQLGAVSGCAQYGGGSVPAGLYGALGAIFARNRNNSLAFSYSFTSGDGSNFSNLSQMTVSHSDGDSLVLTFGTAGADYGSGVT